MSSQKHARLKGRSDKSSPHVRHYIWQMRSPAWQSLTLTARCLEMELKRLYNGTNNGELFLSVREAASRLNIAPNTVAKAFKELEAKGFIKPRQKGSFQWKTKQATSWILTELKVGDKEPTKEFMRWQPTENLRRKNCALQSQELTPRPQDLIPDKRTTASTFNTENPFDCTLSVANTDTQVSYHTAGGRDEAEYTGEIHQCPTPI